MSYKWGEPGRASVLFGGQFGSEGKGLVAAWLAEQIDYPIGVATTAAGAQAGHTTVYRDGRRFVCFHLPTTAVVQKKWHAFVNAGAIIDPDGFLKEIKDCGIYPLNVHISPFAAVIRDEHRTAEHANGSSTERTASTQKGVGAALADKVRRMGKLAADEPMLGRFTDNTIDMSITLHDRKLPVVVEVPQGFSLSLNHSHMYPYTTSRDCWVGSGLDAAGVPPFFLGRVAAVIRTYPIRVGNLYNEHGEQIGQSGPFYHDSQELDWARDFPGIEPERTTVTKRVRRIATFSVKQYEAMLRMNRPDLVVLNFSNYCKTLDEFRSINRLMTETETRLGLAVDRAWGFGPCVEDVTDDWDLSCSWFDKRKPA